MSRKLRFVAEIGAFPISKREHRIAFIAVQDRVRIPEAVGGQKPGIQIGSRRSAACGQPQPPEGGGILLIGFVVKGDLHIVAQLRSISLQSLSGQKDKQHLLFILRKNLRAECPGAGKLLNGNGEHLLIFRILRMQDRFQSGAYAEREEESRKSRQHGLKPCPFPRKDHKDRDQKDQDIQAVMPHQDQEAQPGSQEEQIFFFLKKGFLLHRRLRKKHHHRQHGRRIEGVLGGTEHIHLDHRKAGKIERARHAKPHRRTLFSQKIHGPGKTERQHRHLEKHVTGDPGVVASEDLVSRADHPAQQEHVQQGMMGGKASLRHLIELLLRVINEEPGPHRKQHDPPDQQEKEKDEEPALSHGQAFPAAEESSPSAFARDPRRHSFLHEGIHPLQERRPEQREKGQGQPQPPVA